MRARNDATQHTEGSRAAPNGDAGGRSRRSLAARRPLVSLALQGGGSFGAFTWGVLDRLLEADGVAIDALSGTSAGAVNAVVLASGLAEGGPERARERLRGLWRRLSELAAFTPFGSASRLFAGQEAILSAAVDLSTRFLSPYQFNPLALNPLRGILAEEVDFDLLRRTSPVRLLVAATAVRDGRQRIFQNAELTLEAVLASSCLPLLQRAVSIDGEWYWDGGYTANPPLLPLAVMSQAPDMIVVQVTPAEYDGLPLLAPEIARRLQQIAFNAPLLNEIEQLAALKKEFRARPKIASSRLGRKLRRLRIHRIAAEKELARLAERSALNLDPSFLLELRDAGRAAAEKWLGEKNRARP